MYVVRLAILGSITEIAEGLVCHLTWSFETLGTDMNILFTVAIYLALSFFAIFSEFRAAPRLKFHASRAMSRRPAQQTKSCP
jgi:hypothetical protein